MDGLNPAVGSGRLRREETSGPDASRELMTAPPFDSFASLLGAARSGDERAWSVLYRGTAARMLGYLRMHGAADPEGLLGDTFLQLARNLRKFDGDEAGFRSWAFTIAHHRLIDERRSLRRRPNTVHPPTEIDVVDAGVNVEVEALEAVDRSIVEELLQILSRDQRSVVLLRILGGLSTSETAAALGKSEGAVRVLQYRALRSMKEKLTGDVTP